MNCKECNIISKGSILSLFNTTISTPSQIVFSYFGLIDFPFIDFGLNEIDLNLTPSKLLDSR